MFRQHISLRFIHADNSLECVTDGCSISSFNNKIKPHLQTKKGKDGN